MNSDKGHLFLSPEDMFVHSELLTHDALIDLGRQQEKLDREKKQALEIKEKLLNEIFTFKQTLIVINTTRKIKNSWDVLPVTYYDQIMVDKYIDNVNEYIELIHNEKNAITLENNKLQNDNIEIIAENKKEHEEYEEREKYWTNRVIKLREKCMRKNTIIKTTCIIMIFIIILSVIIYCMGYYNFINLIYFICYFTFYAPLYYIYYSIYNIIYYTYYYTYNGFSNCVLIIN
jgi:hypothetical protein